MGDRFRKTEQILQSSKIWKDAQTSPERNRVWTEPQPADVARRLKRVSVVYYLSRNGHLEHPHFMEVPLSCPDGLYLKDVINRLNLLRGKSLASIYSWSSKRSYKNGFVWHDLSEDDYIHPVHGLEYVLKGSEILLLPHPQPTSHIHECKVYKAEPERQLDGKCVGAGADASTQTEDKRRRSKLVSENENEIVEVEGSPPPVDSSSPETLESLMKADKRLTMSELELAEKRDMWSDSVRGKCIPRKTKASLINSATKKETPNDVVLDTDAKLK
ncbi:hypothetical protein QQ045_017651 [Rhodiola kirilowii]